MTIRQHRTITGLLCIAASLLIALALSSVKQLGVARAEADTPALLDAGAPMVLDGAPAATPSPATSPPSDAASLLDEYKSVKAAYDAIKGAKDKDAKTLLYAALFAGALKLLLDGLKALSDRFNRGKKYIPWVATFIAVPIALLSHFAGGASWFDSLIYAGAGPGAVVIHELFSLFKPAVPAKG